MEIKKFERYCELRELPDLIKNDDLFNEYYDLKRELENFVLDNMNNKEKILNKLRDALTPYKYTLNFGEKAHTALNELKAIREILNLLETYDWNLMYSEYGVPKSAKDCDRGKLANCVTEIAVWEQNGDGQIRNHKKWTTDIPYNNRSITSNDIANAKQIYNKR